MKAKVEIDIDDIVSGLSNVECAELAKRLSTEFLDIEEMIEVIHNADYDDLDIINQLDWDVVKQFVHDGEG